MEVAWSNGQTEGLFSIFSRGKTSASQWNEKLFGKRVGRIWTYLSWSLNIKLNDNSSLNVKHWKVIVTFFTPYVTCNICFVKKYKKYGKKYNPQGFFQNFVILEKNMDCNYTFFDRLSTERGEFLWLMICFSHPPSLIQILKRFF